jgi:hypothetical protein
MAFGVAAKPHALNALDPAMRPEASTWSSGSPAMNSMTRTGPQSGPNLAEVVGIVCSPDSR